MGTELPGSAAPVDEPPPFGKSWNRLYALVLLNLAALIAAFWAFTHAFE